MRKLKVFLRSLVVLVFVAAVAGAIFYTHPLWVFYHFQSLSLRTQGVVSKEVTIGGHRIHYYIQGPESGNPIVLIHGLSGRAEDWVNMAPYLVSAGYRVYTPDLLGFGQSDQPPDATYSIPEEANLVISFLDAMHLPQVDLAGWSMGGWVAQKLAIMHPQRIRRLVLIDSAGLALTPDWDTRLFTPSSAAELDQLDALLMPHPPQIPTFVVRDILRLTEKNAWVVKRALASMLAGGDTTDMQLPLLKMPVLILWADLDHITPLSEGHAMHKLIPQSRLEIAQGCGHLAPEQCAKPYATEVIRFLQADPPLPAEEQILNR